MTLEGKIQIRLVWDGKRISHAALQPRALLQIGTLLGGRSVPQAAQLIPMLFSLCGKAQAAAATTALQAAQGEPAPTPLWRERLVLAEALQELLWRFLLDLPTIMGAQADPVLLAQLRRRCAEACVPDSDEAAWQTFVAELEQTVGKTLFGPTAANWGEIADIEELMRHMRQANTNTAKIVLECWHGMGRWGDGAVALMPQADSARILAELVPNLERNPDFAQHPHWQGQPMETGALARMRAHPVLATLLQQEGSSILARLLARLYEMNELFARLRAPSLPPQAWVQGASPRSGVGLAWVQCARGLLLHRAALNAQGMVEDYRIVAPTEWNFHPAGPCVQGLAGKAAATEEEARRSAELLVQALDPCVAYQIEVKHA